MFSLKFSPIRKTASQEVNGVTEQKAQRIPALRVTLATLNSQYVHAALAPWCLKAGLAAYAAAPHQVKVVEGTVNEKPEKALERILKTRPQVLGLCCYIWNITALAAMLPNLRRAMPQCVIVLGGPEVSHNPQSVLTSHPEVDHIISGEGEQPFALLVDALAANGPLDSIPGLCTRGAEGLRLNPPHFHAAMPPSPIRQDYMDALRGRIAYMETSRGCPYSCAFCLSGGEDKPRWQPLDEAKADILRLAQAGSQTIKFVDRTFNADRKRANQLLRFILGEAGRGIPRGVCFHFEIAGDLMDEEFLHIVSQSPPGLFQFEIGMQSMDENTLRLVRRRTDMGLLSRQVCRLIAIGTAHVHLDLIAGLPEEHLRQFAQGFDEAYALRPHALQLGFLKLIHGSAMREQPEVYPCRYDPTPPYQVTDTPWLSQEDLRTLQVVETALNRLHNSGRFPRTLSWLTRAQGLWPFTLFHALGQAILTLEEGGRTLSLDALTDCLYQQITQLLPQHQLLIRDLMLLDRLSSTATTVLPASLKRRDNRYFPLRRALEHRFPSQGNAPRGVGILYTSRVPCGVYCDYTQRHPVTGMFTLRVVPLHKLSLG